MSEQEIRSFKAKVAELRKRFEKNPDEAQAFLERANRWTVPTWEDDPSAAERIGVKMIPAAGRGA